MTKFWGFILAVTKLSLGIALGLGVVEIVLQLNSHLLLPGISANAPIDLPLTTLEYEVLYSDADVFTWKPGLISPIITDQIEARVTFETDQFGFHNPMPLPQKINGVVLGRSYTQGAQNEANWTMLINATSTYKLLNLAQPGESLERRFEYLNKFGLLHNPDWIIIEVMPAIDIANYHPNNQILIIPRLVTPLIRNLIFSLIPSIQSKKSGAPIYPISTNINGHPIDLTCCIHYTDTYMLDKETITSSKSWQAYQKDLLEEINILKADGYCVALLFAPQKMDIYFSLLDNETLQIIGDQSNVIEINKSMEFSKVNETIPAELLKNNALAMRDILELFTNENNIYWLDPTTNFIESSQNGAFPFMVYDSHWNQLGHQIIADLVDETLNAANCP